MGSDDEEKKIGVHEQQCCDLVSKLVVTTETVLATKSLYVWQVSHNIC